MRAHPLLLAALALTALAVTSGTGHAQESEQVTITSPLAGLGPFTARLPSCSGRIFRKPSHWTRSFWSCGAQRCNASCVIRLVPGAYSISVEAPGFK